LTHLFPAPKLGAPNIWRGLKIGLLGGSFNPAHDGHRHISLEAIKRLKLDAIWWLVSPQNPLKSSKDMAPQAERYQSALKASHHPRIIPVTLESDLKTKYTAQTLKKLMAHFPATNFVWLMGADNLHQFHKWDKWKTITKTMPICILDRPPYGNTVKQSIAGATISKYKIPENKAHELCLLKAPAWSILHIPLNPLSATDIRKKSTS